MARGYFSAEKFLVLAPSRSQGAIKKLPKPNDARGFLEKIKNEKLFFQQRAKRKAGLSHAQPVYISKMPNRPKIKESKRQNELEQIAQKISVCQKCRLAATREKTVPGEGAAGAEYFVVGQGPGANEDKTGRPFIGRAGKLLTDLLALAGIDREKQTFITSIVKCLPTPPVNRKPKPDEIAACSHYLMEQIEIVGAKKIILLGDMAFKKFFPKDKFSDWRGKWRGKEGRQYFISYHPAAGIRFVKFKKILESDFKNLKCG